MNIYGGGGGGELNNSFTQHFYLGMSDENTEIYSEWRLHRLYTPPKLIKLFTLFTEDVGISNHLEI